jgi:putative phage-type endonuclease
MPDPSKPRYLPSFFIGEEIRHKDGTVGTIVKPDRKKVGHYFVHFSDGSHTSQSCSRLYDKNDYLIEDLLQARFLSGADWVSLIDAPTHGLGAEIYGGGDKYIGEFKNGKRVGKGIYLWASGHSYEGYWNGKQNGKGTFIFADGRKYEGDWIDGKKTGKGVFTWPSGDRYDGDFENDSENGKGTYFFADGRKYDGDYVGGKKDGQGIFYFASGDRYEGNFENNTITGKGIYFWANGQRYEGDWLNGKRHGKGRLILTDERQYEGEFKNDVFNGNGTYIWTDGRRYEGEWVDGVIRGKGVFVWDNGRNRYEGTWLDGKKNGYGEEVLDNHSQYSGSFKDGERHGKGEQKIIDGSKFAGTYIGEFECGKWHGYGVRTYANHETMLRYEGFFENGSENGLGKEFFKDGSRYEGSFRNGWWEGLGTHFGANGEIIEQGLWDESELVEPIGSSSSNLNQKYQVISLSQGTKEWLAWRRNAIGASDAPVIMGENPWKSANYLLEEKLGNKKEWAGNNATRLGAANEPKIRQYLVDTFGMEIEPCCIVSTVNTWMQASLDGLSSDKNRVFEIKFGKKIYEHAARFQEPPQYHIGQLQHILAITGLDFIDYVCGWESERIVHIKIKRDDTYIQRLIEAEYQFWKKMKKV